MPSLNQTSSSRAATILAIRAYHRFLVSLHTESTATTSPPDGG